MRSWRGAGKRESRNCNLLLLGDGRVLQLVPVKVQPVGTTAPFSVVALASHVATTIGSFSGVVLQLVAADYILWLA